MQYSKQFSSSRALLAAQEAPGLRIGPAKSQQQHGEGALTRACGRNVVAASEVSDNDTRVLSRRRSAAALAYSDGNEGPLQSSAEPIKLDLADAARPLSTAQSMGLGASCTDCKPCPAYASAAVRQLTGKSALMATRLALQSPSGCQLASIAAKISAYPIIMTGSKQKSFCIMPYSELPV